MNFYFRDMIHFSDYATKITFYDANIKVSKISKYNIRTFESLLSENTEKIKPTKL